MSENFLSIVQAFDVQTLTDVVSIRTPLLTDFFMFATLFGSVVCVFALALIVGLILAWQKRWHVVVGLAASVCGSAVTVAILKAFFERARPDAALAVYQEPFYSFPSWHATLAAALYLFLAYLLTLEAPVGRWRYDIWLGTTLGIVLIGASRIYLGVHFPSDVLAGFVLGSISAWIGIIVSRW